MKFKKYLNQQKIIKMSNFKEILNFKQEEKKLINLVVFKILF